MWATIITTLISITILLMIIGANIYKKNIKYKETIREIKEQPIMEENAYDLYMTKYHV